MSRSTQSPSRTGSLLAAAALAVSASSLGAQLIDREILQRILRHLGLPSEPIQPAPARSPPQGLLGF